MGIRRGRCGGFHKIESHPPSRVVPVKRLRELMIAYGKTGYLALYTHKAPQDGMLILAIRDPREAGYDSVP